MWAWVPTEGMGVVEGFVGVDVADASEDGLVEEGWFDAGAFGADVLGELVGSKVPRFGAEDFEALALVTSSDFGELVGVS